MIEIFENILEKAKAEIQANMAAKGINASGRTSASFRVERTITGVRLVMGGADTAPLKTLEVGVTAEEAPRHLPTFARVLEQWSRDKGLVFESESRRRSFAWLLGRKIQREGTLRSHSPVDVYSSVVMQTADDVKVMASVEMTRYIHNLFNR